MLHELLQCHCHIAIVALLPHISLPPIIPRNRACAHARRNTHNDKQFVLQRHKVQWPNGTVARSGTQGEGNTCRAECVCSPYCARSCDHRDKKQPRHHRGLWHTGRSQPRNRWKVRYSPLNREVRYQNSLGLDSLCPPHTHRVKS